MNSLDKKYQELLQDILDNGVRKEDRTGTGTISVFGRQIRHKMSDGFPLLTTKKMAWKTMVTELLWFLRGDTNIKFLVDNNCHIWDGDAYKNYWNSIETSEYDGFGPKSIKLPTLTQEEFINKIKIDDEFAKKWGELGPIYGKQWRKWGTGENVTIGHNGLHTLVGEKVIDQITNLINDLKTNPDSRRLMVSAWNVGELDSMILPPCHYGFQVYTRELSLRERNNFLGDKKYAMLDGDYIWPTMIEDKEKYEKILNEANIPTRAISLMWNQRSVDTFLGLPFNIASYGLLLEIIAKEVNMVPDELIGNLGDVHLYSNHIEQAKEQIGRELSLDEIKKIYIDWTLSKSCGGYAGDLKEDTIKFANQIFVEGWQNIKDPFTGKPLIELECFVLNPKRTREPYPLPKLILDDWYSTQGDPSNTPKDISEFLKNIHVSHIRIENYQSHPSIKAPLSN